MEKTAKNTFVGERDRFEGSGESGDKYQNNLFCRHRRFEYFSFNNFFKESNIFQNNGERLFLRGVTIFEGMGRRTTKMNITFFWKNGVSNTVFKFFSQKIQCRLTETRKTGFGVHFPPYLWFY